MPGLTQHVTGINDDIINPVMDCYNDDIINPVMDCYNEAGQGCLG